MLIFHSSNKSPNHIKLNMVITKSSGEKVETMYENRCSNRVLGDTLTRLRSSGSLILITGGSGTAKVRVQNSLFGDPDKIRIPVLAAPSSQDVDPDNRYPWENSEGADLAVLRYDPEDPEELVNTLNSMFKQWEDSEGAKDSHIRIGIDKIDEVFENMGEQSQVKILEKLSTLAQKYCAMVHLIDRNDSFIEQLTLNDNPLEPLDIIIEVRNTETIEYNFNLIDETCSSGWHPVAETGLTEEEDE